MSTFGLGHYNIIIGCNDVVCKYIYMSILIDLNKIITVLKYCIIYIVG